MRPTSSYDHPFKRVAAELHRAGELQRFDELLDETVGTAGWSRLMELIEQAREHTVAVVVDGETQTQAGYARLAGFAAGLEQLLTAATTIRDFAAARRAESQAEANRPAEPVEMAPDGLTEAT